MIPQTVTITSIFQILNSNQKYTANLNTYPIVVGNHCIQTAVSVDSKSWQTVSQSNNSTFRYGCFTNNGITSSVFIGVGGTASYSSILSPGDSCILASTGSPIIYIKASGSLEVPLVTYTLVEC